MSKVGRNMEKYNSYKKYVKVIFDIITQMLMFKNKTLDNPLFKFLVKNIISETQNHNDVFSLDFLDVECKDFFESFTKELKEFSLACEVALTNNDASELINSKIIILANLHEEYIIKKEYLK